MKWLYLYLFLVLLETILDFSRRAYARGWIRTPVWFVANLVGLPFLLWRQLREL